jgi:hypothetical protein
MEYIFRIALRFCVRLNLKGGAPDMSGALERFITSVRNFLAKPQEKEKAEEAPLQRMPEREERETLFYRTAEREEEEEEEPSEVTLAEGAGFVVKREAEA